MLHKAIGLSLASFALLNLSFAPTAEATKEGEAPITGIEYTAPTSTVRIPATVAVERRGWTGPVRLETQPVKDDLLCVDPDKCGGLNLRGAEPSPDGTPRGGLVAALSPGQVLLVLEASTVPWTHVRAVSVGEGWVNSSFTRKIGKVTR